MIALLVLASALTIPPGIYSSWHIQRDTGDELGMELELNTAPSPTIRFTLCEGACGEIVHSPVTPTRDGRGFDFDYRQPDLPQTIRFAARYRGGTLIVRQLGGYDDQPQRLRHLAAPRGLVSRHSR